MNSLTKKIIILAVVIILCIGCYFLYENTAKQTYNEGVYVVGDNISAGTYERTGSAYVLNGGFISMGDTVVIKNDTGAEVFVKSGTLKYINDTTEYKNLEMT